MSVSLTEKEFSNYTEGHDKAKELTVFAQYKSILCQLQSMMEQSHCGTHVSTLLGASLFSTGGAPNVFRVINPEMQRFQKDLEKYYERPFLFSTQYSQPKEEFERRSIVVGNTKYQQVFEGEVLQMIDDGEHIHTYQVHKIYHAYPFEGATGVILSRVGTKEILVCFRSAIETSTFVNIGKSNILDAPLCFDDDDPTVEINSYLGTLFHTHYSDKQSVAAIMKSLQPDKIIFLGFSMGGAIGQLALYDMLCKQSMRIPSEHLFLGSPRFASQGFYDSLGKQIQIHTFVSAIRHKGLVYLDPIPMLGQFADPHHISLIGNLNKVDPKKDIFQRDILDPQASGPIDIQSIATKWSFRGHCQSSHVGVLFACLAGEQFGNSCMSLHNLAYFTLACYGVLRQSEGAAFLATDLADVEDECTSWD